MMHLLTTLTMTHILRLIGILILALKKSDSSATYLYGHNRLKWSNVPHSSRTWGHNIVLHLPGVKGPALDNKLQNPIDAWCSFVSRNIIELIVECTNKKIGQLSQKYGLSPTYIQPVSEVELRAFWAFCY